MKKLLLVAALLLFLTGCGHLAQESEFYQHSTMWRTWDHAAFSCYGYNNPTAEDAAKSDSQDWWGIPITMN
jgi:hypothetical protein